MKTKNIWNHHLDNKHISRFWSHQKTHPSQPLPPRKHIFVFFWCVQKPIVFVVCVCWPEIFVSSRPNQVTLQACQGGSTLIQQTWMTGDRISGWQAPTYQLWPDPWDERYIYLLEWLMFMVNVGEYNHTFGSGWWLNQPIWKICSSNWKFSPGFGVKIKNIWNHHLVSEITHWY